MPSTVFTSIDQLPVSLNVSQVAAFLGISKATAYTLFHSDGFPSLYVGRKLIVPRDRFIEWLNTAVDENKQDHIDVSTARKQTRRNNDESNKPRVNPPSFSYSMDDLDCKLCLYYGGKENHEAICLAAECCCKDEIAAAKSREKRF